VRGRVTEFLPARRAARRISRGVRMALYLTLAVAIGLIGGLRTMTALAAVTWAVWLGHPDLTGSWLAFLGHRYTPWIVSLLALAEFVTDQLPSTPSRKVPLQFGGRILTGALTGAIVGLEGGVLLPGLLAGVAGAVIGTLGGAEVRRRLAARFGRDLPAALLEDAVAIVGALLVVAALT
jgi:uncharacterized membrane protein